MKFILQWLFGCLHPKTSIPFTLPNPSGRGKQTYVVCLDCGKKFDYSLTEMRVEGIH